MNGPAAVLDAAALGSEQRMLIGGELVHAATGRTFVDRNPATEDVIGEVADAGPEDMDRAIAAARAAFDDGGWSADRALRKRCLEQLRDALTAEREAIRAELVAEIGCPPKTHGSQVDGPIDHGFDFPLELIDSYAWDRVVLDQPGAGRALVAKEPVGVVAAITPWNFPFEIALTKLVATLATGCAVILKPAADSPFNATRLGRIIAESTDIPSGVVNVVTTSDDTVAERLVADPRVDAVSFTGSTATGRRIAAIAAATVKRTFLELGGKSAHIVLDDADLAAVLPISTMVCVHAGQGCALLTRLLVPRSRYDECIPILADAFGRIGYGDPTDPANVMGPLISERQRERVLGYIRDGVASGARLLLGGGVPTHLPKGYYVEPTVFLDVDNSMRIAQEEIFGPVLTVTPYEDDDDAVRIANDSIYGLSAGISTTNAERGLAVARRVRAGGVSIGWNAYGGPVPFGGYKQSGVGRQNGVEGFEQYLETKSLTFSTPAAIAREP